MYVTLCNSNSSDHDEGYTANGTSLACLQYKY